LQVSRLDYTCVSQGISSMLEIEPIPRQLFHTSKQLVTSYAMYLQANKRN